MWGGACPKERRRPCSRLHRHQNLMPSKKHLTKSRSDQSLHLGPKTPSSLVILQETEKNEAIHVGYTLRCRRASQVCTHPPPPPPPPPVLASLAPPRTPGRSNKCRGSGYPYTHAPTTTTSCLYLTTPPTPHSSAVSTLGSQTRNLWFDSRGAVETDGQYRGPVPTS